MVQKRKGIQSRMITSSGDKFYVGSELLPHADEPGVFESF